MSEWDNFKVVSKAGGEWGDFKLVSPAAVAEQSTATAEPPQSGGILSSLARAPRAFKEGAESAIGSTLNFVTGGYWQDMIGYDPQKEGMSYQEDISRRQQQTDMLNKQAAGDSTAGGLFLDATTAAGAMAPAIAGGTAARPAQALATTFGIQATGTAPQYYSKARKSGKGAVGASVYAAIQTGFDIATELAGAKIAGALGAVTPETLLNSKAVKSITGALLGTASEGTEEVVTDFLQNVTDVVSGVDPKALTDTQYGKSFVVGAMLGAAVNSASYGAGKVEEFLANPSRTNARKLGIGETSAKEREAIAEQAKQHIQPTQEQQASTITPTQETPNVQEGQLQGREGEVVPPPPEVTREAPGIATGAVPDQTPAQPEVAPQGPTEAQDGGYSPDLTSARKEWMAQDRQRLGLDELPEPEQRSWEQDLANAREAGIPDQAQSIAQSIISQPRALTDTETAGLVVHAAEIKNKHEILSSQIAKQPESAAPDPTLSAELERLQQDFDTLTQALKMSGSEKGRNLAAQKLTINRDYSLVSVKNRAKTAKKQPLTEKDNQKISKAVENLAAKETQLQKAIDKAKARLEELEAHLEAGTLPETKTRKPSPKELEDINAMIAAVRRSIANSEAAKRKRLEATIAKLEERLKTGDIKLPGRRAAPLSPEIERLEFQRDKARNEVNVRINELKPKTFREFIRQPFDLARTIITSMDFPPVFRQGGMIALGNPGRAAKATVAGFKAMFSEQQAHKILKEIDERPNSPLYARSKLYLADLDGLRIHQEEAYVGHLANTIPILRTIKNASERNYTVFLNRLRADTFDAMSSSLTRNGEPTMEEARAIARYINVATGRGDFNSRMDTALSEMAAYFFSPRYVASRFQAIIGQPLYRSPTETRGLIAKEYGKMMAGAAVIYATAIAAGAGLDDDGKLNVGDTHIDPLFGMIQTARFIRDNTRAAADTVKSWATGSDRKLVYSQSMGPWRFLRSKFSPIMAAAEDIRTGTTFMGEPTTPGSLAANFLTPLSFTDVVEATKAQGVPGGLALWLASLFGVGIQTWHDNPADGPKARKRPQRTLSRYAPK